MFLLSWNTSQAQWTSLGCGIDASSARAIWSISVVDENIVWAVAWDEINIQTTFEFTRTTDGGITWHSGLVEHPAQHYIQHVWAADSLTAWVSTANFNPPFEGGVYKTTNGGETWVHQNTAYAEPGTVPHAVHFYDASNGFTFGCPASGNFRAYTTSNGGDTWEPASMPAALPSEFVEGNTGNGLYAAVGDKVWFVTGKARVFKSDDRGHNWYLAESAFSPAPTPNNGPNSIAFKDSLNGIVVSYWPPEAARTTDGGNTWEPLTNFPNFNVVQVEYIPGTQGAYITHGGYGFNGSLHIVKTCDDGMNWEVITANRNVSTLEFLSPTVGYGGDKFSNATLDGMFKWDSDLLTDCPLLPPSATKELVVVPLNISPNPASDFLNTQLPETAAAYFDLCLFDMQGKLLSRQSLAVGQQVDVKNLPPGMYLLKATAGERHHVGWFIKQ